MTSRCIASAAVTLALGCLLLTPPAQCQTADEAKKAVKELIDQKKAAEAETYARRFLARAEAEYGTESIQAAEAYDLLVKALMAARRGRDPGTRAAAERAVALKEKTLGPHDLQTAASLVPLAHIVSLVDGPGAAVPYYERVLAIREKALGVDHAEVARSLCNLGNALIEAGDYVLARGVLERSLRIMEKSLGQEHLDTAIVRNSLAILLRRTGDYVTARRLFALNLEYQREALGPDNDQELGTLINLSLVLLDLGDLDEALTIQRRILSWAEAHVTADRRNLMVPLMNLATTLARKGDLAESRDVFMRALAIGTAGPSSNGDDLNLAGIRVGLGNTLTEMGLLEEARQHYEAGIEAEERTLGASHPQVAGDLGDYSRFLWKAGEPGQALETALRAESIARTHFLESAGALAEREALLFERSRARGRDVALTVLASAPQVAAPYIRARVWDQMIRSRGLVLDVTAARQRVAWSSRDSVTAPLVAALDAARQRLSRLLVKGPDEDVAEYTEKVNLARREMEQAERSLAGRSAFLQRWIDEREVGFGAVSAALPAGSAVVGYFRYSQVGRNPGEQDRASYLAFVQHSREDAARVVPLGSAEEIDHLIDAYAAAVGAYPRARGAPAVDHRRIGEDLRLRIWDPVIQGLEDVRMVFVVPDGSIHRINIATLPLSRDEYLLETGPLLHQLSTERDLLNGETSPGTGVLVLGGPDFDRRSVKVALASQPGGADPEAVYRSAAAHCGEARSLRFDPLAGARAEADEIFALLSADAGNAGTSVRKLTGEAATEEALKAGARGNRILHLATHGFFMQESCGASVETTASSVKTSADRGDGLLVLSGLALAGANRRLEAAEHDEDGIVTAEEIASLDLTGVDWVVLSACSSGLGTIASGEGVIGLRRAFQIAGASTIIMSLWRVEDSATRKWMSALYEGRLAGRSTAESMRHASMEMLDALRRKGKTPHPYFWGAFIAAGDWD